MSIKIFNTLIPKFKFILLFFKSKWAVISLLTKSYSHFANIYRCKSRVTFLTPEGALRIFKRKPTSLSHFVFCYFLSFPSRLQLHFRVSLCSGLTSSMPLQGSSNIAPSPCQPAQFRANFSIHSLPRGYYQGLFQSCICKHSRVCIRLYISLCVCGRRSREHSPASVSGRPRLGRPRPKVLERAGPRVRAARAAAPQLEPRTPQVRANGFPILSVLPKNCEFSAFKALSRSVFSQISKRVKVFVTPGLLVL